MVFFTKLVLRMQAFAREISPAASWFPCFVC